MFMVNGLTARHNITQYEVCTVGLNIFLFGNIYRYKDNTHI